MRSHRFLLTLIKSFRNENFHYVSIPNRFPSFSQMHSGVKVNLSRLPSRIGAASVSPWPIYHFSRQTLPLGWTVLAANVNWHFRVHDWVNERFFVWPSPRASAKCNDSQVVGLTACLPSREVMHGCFAHGLLDYMQNVIDRRLAGSWEPWLEVLTRVCLSACRISA